jgi:ornithine carbamoyltransferase
MNNPSASPRHLCRLLDLNRDQLLAIMAIARKFKVDRYKGIRFDPVLQGKVAALVFEKPSLRTKVAFEIGAQELGAQAVFLSSSQILASGGHQHGRESIPDIGRNLERFVDLIVARVYRHQVITELRETCRVPIVNALCDLHHPTQAIADMLTIDECFPGHSRQLKVAFVGDGNNVARSLMEACALLGHRFVIAAPQGYELPNEALENLPAHLRSLVSLERKPQAAVDGADVLYTDTFVSMGQEAECAARARAFSAFQVNANLMRIAKPTAIFLHCLPAHRGEEVTSEVMDSPQSRVFDQAEWRLYTAKAVLVWCMERGL